MILSGTDVTLRAIGGALAGVSIVFAGSMFLYGGGEVRVVGMEHLAIFAQPRGLTLVAPRSAPADATSVDMNATGSVATSVAVAEPPSRPEMVAARNDRAWLKANRKIVPVAPGEDVAGLGRIGAIVRRGSRWELLDDKGATLLSLADLENGAALFSHKLILP